MSNDEKPAGPCGSPLTDGLGPLPERTLAEIHNPATGERKLSETGTAYHGSNWREVRKLYTAADLHAYALQERAALRASIEPAWAQSLEHARGDEKATLRALIADDAIAATYQSLGQYRTALLRGLGA